MFGKEKLLMKRNRYATNLAAAVIVCALAGCASPVVVLSEFRPAENAAKLQIVDARPEKERSTEFISLSITNCDYGIRRLGDETPVPSRLVVLQSDLVRSLGTSAYGKVVTVAHYTIHSNSGAALRASVYGAKPGIIATVMEPIGSNCPKEKTSEGWYSADELNAPHSPIIIEIEASFEGQTHMIRSVYAPPVEFLGRFSEPVGTRALIEAINRAHAALSESIRRRREKI